MHRYTRTIGNRLSRRSAATATMTEGNALALLTTPSAPLDAAIVWPNLNVFGGPANGAPRSTQRDPSRS
eukprot:scaffold25842_cov198-Amphora_coffeaeformis.AAC.11